METPRALLPLLLLLWVLAGARAGDGDFDLADALDDPEPTSKPSGGLYPKLPQDPAAPDPYGGNVYPPPRPRPPPPRPRPQPRPHHDYDDGGFGGHTGLTGEGDPGARPFGGGGASGREEPSHHDSTQGSTVARIVSPIVTVVVVALLGAGASYFRSGLQRGCLGGRRGDSAPV